MSPVVKLLVSALVAVLVGGCFGPRAPSFQCIDNGDCGELEACFEGGVCQPVDCLSSVDCRIREYCDQRTYVCRAGCSQNEDCIAGENCDVATNTCEPYGCRDSALDCRIGEVCSEVTGQCIRDTTGHCDICDPDPWGFNPRGTCRDRDAVCLTFQGAPDFYCFLDCENSECPRGYECINTGNDFNGNGRSDSLCIAYCPLLYEKGWK